MMPSCQTVRMKKHTIRMRRGINIAHASTSSSASVKNDVAAWNQCGKCCMYHPIQVGSGPFWQYSSSAVKFRHCGSPPMIFATPDSKYIRKYSQTSRKTLAREGLL